MVSTSGPPASHLLAWHVKRKHPEIRWVADYRDLWTQNPIFPGLFPFTYLEKVLERRILSRADAVVTVSEGLAHVLRAHCDGKIHVIENGFDEEDTESIPARISNPGRFCTGVYGDDLRFPSGSCPPLRCAEGPSIAAYCAGVTRHPSAIPGDEPAGQGTFGGPSRIAWPAELPSGSNRPLPHRDAIGIQKGADALLLLERDPVDSNDQGVLTGKVFEYLAARKPILGVGFGPGGELGKLLVSSGLGNPLGRDTLRIRQALERMISAEEAGTADQAGESGRGIHRPVLPEETGGAAGGVARLPVPAVGA